MTAILDEDAGYAVRVFSGEDTSIDQLAESDPDLIIIDLLLGGASGWEIVTLARADRRLAGVPIIVCSADVNGLRTRATELERIGNVHLMTKPFGIEEMTSLVESVIGQPEAAVG